MPMGPDRDMFSGAFRGFFWACIMFELLEWLEFMVLGCGSEYPSHQGSGLNRLDAFVNNCEAVALIDLESTSSQSTNMNHILLKIEAVRSTD